MKKQLIATMAATTLGGIAVAMDSQQVQADENTESNQVSSSQTLTHTVQAGDTLSALANQYGTTVASLVEKNSIQNQNLIIVGQRLVVGSTTTQATQPTTKPVQQTTKTTYTVQAGDTVSAIADRFGVTVDSIGQTNQLANIHLVFIGQTLTIEHAATTTETTAPVETPAAQTPAPVETPVAETTTPAETPAAQTPAPVETPAAQTPAPVETPAAQTPAPVETPAAQTPAPVETPVAQTPAPVETPAAQTPAPVETPVAQTPAPVETPVVETPTVVDGIYVVKSGDTIGTIASKNGVTVDNIVSWNNLSNANMIFVGQKLTVVGTAPKEETTIIVTPSTPNTNQPVVIDTNTNSTVNTPTNTVISSDATLNALNDLRVSKGLNPVVWDAGLAASATARANIMATNGLEIPNDHWHRADEVIAFYFAQGATVINAWYNETNMITASGTGHRDWELNPNITRVGFGYNGVVTVGHSK